MNILIKKIKNIFFVLLLLTVSVNSYAQEKKQDKIGVYNKNTPKVIEKLLPSVVNISAEKSAKYVDLEEGYYEEDIENEPESLGSGFIISEDGYIITNNHVVENADKVFVTLKGSDKKFPADIVGTDKKTDIAVLKMNLKVKLPYLEFDTDNLHRIGDQIIVAGNPFNLGTSVSIGIISALNRDIKMSAFDNFIQTDAAINRGNSGGPMFNLDGKVIGITSAIYSPDGGNVGIGFAIPASNAIPIIEKLKRDGFVRRGWLGVVSSEVDREVLQTLGLGSNKGVLVTDVAKGGPADKGGIQISDIIISYNEQKIKKLKDLPIMVSSTEIGSEASIVVYRNREKINLNVKIAESKEDDKYDSTYEAIAGGAVEVFDMYVVPIDNLVKRKFKLGNQKGLFVLKVKKGGLSDKKGIKNGDIILSINQNRITTKELLIKILNERKRSGAEKVVLIINKNKNSKNSVILIPIKSNGELDIRA